MLDTTLIELLPEQISDETAYHLVNFISNLTLALESRYFTQLKRYTQDHLEWIIQD